MGGWWRWALVSPDGVAFSQMVGVSASLNLPLHHKVQKFCSGTGSPRWSRKKGSKMAAVWWWYLPHTGLQKIYIKAKNIQEKLTVMLNEAKWSRLRPNPQGKAKP